jgi:hypothetical protein
MTDADLDLTAAWLKREQGIEMERAHFADAAGTSAMIGELARKSAARLPFDAEPSRLAHVLHALAPKGRRS